MEITILLVITVAVVFVVAVHRPVVAQHRRRQRTAAALEWIRTLRTPVRPVAPEQEQPAAIAAFQEDDDVLDVQVLRDQVRELEQELLSTAFRATDTDSDLLAHSRRVDTVIRALGTRLGSMETPEALARVSAGIDRLVLHERFARPTLTVSWDRPEVPASGPSDTSAAMSLVPESSSVTVVDEEAAVASSAWTEPAVETPVMPEVVLPVPPLAQPVAKRRSRSWFTRGRAA